MRITQVRRPSGESNFQTAVLHTGTALHETDSSFDVFVAAFARAGSPDLVAIKKSATGTGTTEVHVLSGSSRFQEFIEQSGTALHETDGSFAFAPVQWDAANPALEIAAIKKRGTGTNSTEVHVLRQ